MSLDAQEANPASRVRAVWAQLEHDNIFQAIKLHVRDVMSSYDPSHDFDHVLRVLNTSHQILQEEYLQTGSDPEVVYYSALLHDLFDRKYTSTSSAGNMKGMLTQHGKDEAWAARVEGIAENISYKHEVSNPEVASRALAAHPELAIVQDADRLDAIGAIGIGRVFTYGGAKAPHRGLQGSVNHFVEKLEKLEAMMKTETGKRMAKERTDRLRLFRSWWEEEMATAGSSVTLQDGA